MGEMRNAYEVLVRGFVGKRPLERSRREWDYNIRMYHREIGWEGLDWMHVAQDEDQSRAHVNTVMNLRVL
jgi:hypothetical protein